ncbi:LOW QUALITY PROTEIN: uncharacterized protein [Montipora capricornis]|uniref:LOW QUALITY PROTEIN: uncharacterized protein n=1 Tax=Montipora capricornis TaxID=246305 RepID=UPI0035F14AB3
MRNVQLFRLGLNSDFNECNAAIFPCHLNAICKNNEGSYVCSCKAGYTGNGKSCTDVNECAASSRVCHINALCTNTPGSSRCTCNPGGESFAYTTSNELLLAAGGGGGASSEYNEVDGQAGTRGSNSVGRYSSRNRKEGSGGFPGKCNSAIASYHGGVGAGWLAQGCVRAGQSHGERVGSRAQGWVGGRAGAMNSGYNGGPPPGAVGGFGGGGRGSEDNGASRGGGGDSGGGSGTHSWQAGGSEGSYCSGASCSRLSGRNSNDDGMVQIVELPG